MTVGFFNYNLSVLHIISIYYKGLFVNLAIKNRR
jgi:hypothetical protein